MNVATARWRGGGGYHVLSFRGATPAPPRTAGGRRNLFVMCGVKFSPPIQKAWGIYDPCGSLNPGSCHLWHTQPSIHFTPGWPLPKPTRPPEKHPKSAETLEKIFQPGLGIATRMMWYIWKPVPLQTSDEPTKTVTGSGVSKKKVCAWHEIKWNSRKWAGIGNSGEVCMVARTATALPTCSLTDGPRWKLLGVMGLATSLGDDFLNSVYNAPRIIYFLGKGYSIWGDLTPAVNMLGNFYILHLFILFWNIFRKFHNILNLVDLFWHEIRQSSQTILY